MTPELILNPKFRAGADGLRDTFSSQAVVEAKRDITSWPGYEPTPLLSLKHLAQRERVGSLLYKDESRRFNLGSFKALGGAYAIQKLLEREVTDRLGRAPTVMELLAPARHGQSRLTVCCATDGNHGRSVAWAAKLFGLRAVIYVHANVSASRKEALAALGADVVSVPGVYDDAVQRATVDADREGWTIVSDTSFDGYRDIPADVMRGYTLMMEEVCEQASLLPTHVFVQCGVGALPASVSAYFSNQYGELAPKVIVVEPIAAACLMESAKHGRLTNVSGDLATIMAGLACGHPSQLAWEVLCEGAAAFMTVAESDAVRAVRLLYAGSGDEPPVIAGETGAVGLAGFLAANREPRTRESLGIDEDSVVLTIGTEGDTDPQLFRSIVDLDDEDVEAFCARHLQRARELARSQ